MFVWLNEHLVFVQGTGIFGCLAALTVAGQILSVSAEWKRNPKMKAQVKGEIVKAHRDLYAHIRTTSGTEGIFDRERDLSIRPRTPMETEAVRDILLHFAWALSEHRAGRYDLPEALAADFRNFFGYPVRLDAWRELRQFHDRRVVAFIERIAPAAR